MDFISALDIGASGLSAERTHLNVISMNLANVNTTRTPEGGPYRRKSVVFQSQSLDSEFTKAMRSELEREVKGVKVIGVVTDQRPFKRIYDPGHPDADGQGYVSLPDINVVEEMTNMMTALRTYEANAATISAIKTMYNKAVELGR
jgi:flagellar basal-body rod protein FlgC